MSKTTGELKKAFYAAEKAASKSSAQSGEDLFRVLIEQNPAIIYLADFDQKVGVTYIGPQIEALGFTQEEWVADPQLWVRQLHPDDRERVLRETDDAAKSGQIFRSEYRLLAKDGTVYWFLDEGKNVYDKNGKPLIHQGLMLDITERKKTEEALSIREHYLSKLNAITASVISLQNTDEPVKNLAQELKETFNADHCFITRWDEERKKSFIWDSASSIEHERMMAIFPNDERSVTNTIIRQKKLIVIENLAASSQISPKILQSFPSRSLIGIPLFYKDEKIGAIIAAYNVPRKFAADEIERAEHAGRQIAIAIWSAQQDHEVRKRLNEQKTLAQITTALSQVEHIGLSKVLDLIVRSAKELISEARQAVIHLADKNNEYLVSQAVSGYALTQVNVGKIRIGEGAAGLVMSSGKSIYIPSIQEDPRFINFNADVKYNSLLVSPVGSGGRVIGTLSIQSEKPFAFQKSDIDLLNDLGLQAAIAIENTRLYDAAQQDLKERILAEAALRGSEERYRGISEDIAALICRFDRDGLLTYVNPAYAEFFGGEPNEYHLRSLFDFVKTQEQKAMIRSRYLMLTPSNPSVTYEIRETNQHGEKRWLQWTDRLISHKNDAQAEFQSIGVDITARKLAEIERERLLTVEHEQRLRAETSAEATLALVSHTSLDKILVEILNQVQRLFPDCGANITLLENGILKTVARSGYENRGDKLYDALQKDPQHYPLTKSVVEKPHILIIADTAQEPNWIHIPGLEWIRSHLSIPLIMGGKLLGMLYLDEDAPNKFSEETVKRLTPLTNAATVALESAALINTTRQALRETQALYRIHRGMSALNVDELLDDTVNLLKDIFNYYHAQVFSPNPETGDLIIRAASDKIGKTFVAEKHELSINAGIIGHVARTRKPFATNNVDEVPFYYPMPALPKTKAEMAIPVQNAEKLFGVLDIQQTAAHPFNERDQQLAQTVAEQLAIAMHRAELYENLQTSLEQEKSTRRQLIQNERLAVMGQLLASVSHELNNPLQAIQNALFLLKEEKEILISISDTGTGISPRILPVIFDPFVTDKKSGTGIGLTISHDIIAQHQGRIAAENNDAGATFKIWLPIQRDEAEAQ